MTILDHEPSQTNTHWHAEPIRPTYGPTLVGNWGEGELPMRAIVRVAVAVTRDQLVYALAEQFSCMSVEDPDELTVEEIRFSVEAQFFLDGALEIEQESRYLWLGQSRWAPEDRARMEGLARAIDRAYPPANFGTTVVDGSPLDPTVRCTTPGCDWTAPRGMVESMMLAGAEHSETHGGH